MYINIAANTIQISTIMNEYAHNQLIRRAHGHYYNAFYTTTCKPDDY